MTHTILLLVSSLALLSFSRCHNCSFHSFYLLRLCRLPMLWNSSPICILSCSGTLCLIQTDHLPLEELHATRLSCLPATEKRWRQEEPAVWVFDSVWAVHIHSPLIYISVTVDHHLLYILTFSSLRAPHSSCQQCRGWFGQRFRFRCARWAVQLPEPEPSQPDWPQLHREGLRCTGPHLPGKPDAATISAGEHAKPRAAGATGDEAAKRHGLVCRPLSLTNHCVCHFLIQHILTVSVDSLL